MTSDTGRNVCVGVFLSCPVQGLRERSEGTSSRGGNASEEI